MLVHLGDTHFVSRTRRVCATRRISLVKHFAEEFILRGTTAPLLRWHLSSVSPFLQGWLQRANNSRDDIAPRTFAPTDLCLGYLNALICTRRCASVIDEAGTCTLRASSKPISSICSEVPSEPAAHTHSVVGRTEGGTSSMLYVLPHTLIVLAREARSPTIAKYRYERVCALYPSSSPMLTI